MSKFVKIFLSGVGVLAVALWCAAPASAQVTIGGSSPANQIFRQYSIPGAPLNIVIESPGAVWFTMPGASAIGSLVVSPTVQFQQYATPTAASEPYDLVYVDGLIWFTERSGNKIGRFDIQTGQFEEYLIPTPNSEPRGIAVANDGKIWFTEWAANQIGRFDPTTSTFTEYTYETPDAGLEDLALADNTTIWITAPNLDQVVYLRISAGEPIFTPISTSPQERPTKITLDNNGLPWITATDSNLIGRYAPGTLSLWRWYELPNTKQAPLGITFQTSADGWTIWFTENSGNGVGQLRIKENGDPIQTRDQRLPTARSSPQGIAVDADGHVWIATSGGREIAEWLPPYFELLYLPLIANN